MTVDVIFSLCGFLVSCATAVFAIYTYFRLIRLTEAVMLESKRLSEVAAQQLQFMKITHAKWDEEDMRRLKNQEPAGTVGETPKN